MDMSLQSPSALGFTGDAAGVVVIGENIG